MGLSPPLRALRHLARRPWRDVALAGEGLVMVALGRLAVVVLPFRVIARLASRPVRRPPPDEAQRDLLRRRVRWAVLSCAHRVPWRAMCFEQGLAAHWMLRRRGVPTVLNYGARPGGDKGLEAHVWILDGTHPVVGHEAAPGFALLVQFPPPPAPPA